MDAMIARRRRGGYLDDAASAELLADLITAHAGKNVEDPDDLDNPHGWVLLELAEGDA